MGEWSKFQSFSHKIEGELPFYFCSTSKKNEKKNISNGMMSIYCWLSSEKCVILKSTKQRRTNFYTNNILFISLLFIDILLLRKQMKYDDWKQDLLMKNEDCYDSETWYHTVVNGIVNHVQEDKCFHHKKRIHVKMREDRKIANKNIW